MRILFVSRHLNVGGIETFLMNIVRNIDLSINQVDFLFFRNEDKAPYAKELKKLGCSLNFVAPANRVGGIMHIVQLCKVIKRGNYDVVHCNTHLGSGYVMFAAWLCHVKIRVTHSHSSRSAGKTIRRRLKWSMGRLMIRVFSNRKIACGEAAGKALFGNTNFIILENGVDFAKFKFDVKKRNAIRKQLNIGEKDIVVGHIGRFTPVKNYPFIISVFEDILSTHQIAKLLLLGDGEDFASIKKLITSKGLSRSVILTGNVDNSYEYYNVMDVMLHPSLHEAFPFVFVEAQANGLNIVASNTIPRESNLIGNVKFLDLLVDNTETWSNEVVKSAASRNFKDEFFINSRYDLKTTVRRLFDIYRGDAKK